MDSKETRLVLFESARIKFNEIWEDMKKIRQENARKNWYQKHNKRRGKGK